MKIHLYRVNNIGPKETAHALLPPNQSNTIPSFGEPPPEPEPSVNRELLAKFSGTLAEKMASDVMVKLAVELGQRWLELYEVSDDESEKLIAVMGLYY